MPLVRIDASASAASRHPVRPGLGHGLALQPEAVAVAARSAVPPPRKPSRSAPILPRYITLDLNYTAGFRPWESLLPSRVACLLSGWGLGRGGGAAKADAVRRCDSARPRRDPAPPRPGPRGTSGSAPVRPGPAARPLAVGTPRRARPAPPHPGPGYRESPSPAAQPWAAYLPDALRVTAARQQQPCSSHAAAASRP